jgi:Leucine-rich repeat (LRR) protein
MHTLLQEQIDQHLSLSPRKKKRSRYFDQDGNFVVEGLFLGYQDEVRGVPAPWQGDGSCYNMSIPNIAVNIAKIPDWEEEITQTPEFEGIETLVIGGDVEDFSFVSHFTGLRELYLYTYNEEDGRHAYPCEDWSFLTELENLNYLVAMNCPYFDTAPLRVLWEKQRENRRVAKAEGYDTLDMPALDHLILHTCNIEDLSDFAAARYIADCNLSHNNISDLTPILDVGFYYLNLRYNKLASLPDLRVEYYLNVRHNEITQIPDWCAELSRFFIAHNPIAEIPAWVYEYAENMYFVYDDLGELLKTD